MLHIFPMNYITSSLFLKEFKGMCFVSMFVIDEVNYYIDLYIMG